MSPLSSKYFYETTSVAALVLARVSRIDENGRSGRNSGRRNDDRQPYIHTLGALISMPFDLQPILKGELLGLRPLRAEDFGDLYAVASDPLMWEQHPVRDRYKEEVFTAFFRESLESGGALIAIDSKDGRVIGSSRFHGYDEGRGEIEIGWTFLARSHWGGMYNKEMKQLMLRHAFRYVNSVIFLVGLQNFRSQRAMEKIGGVRVGSRRDAGGRESLVYQITAPI
jgi:RimJ/RimL family protein N-acetyltransferase